MLRRSRGRLRRRSSPQSEIDRRADRRHRPGPRLRARARSQAGKHVVTANKQLVAQHGDELFDAAREAGVQLRFEAAVAGVVPVIRVIQESLAATRDRRRSSGSSTARRTSSSARWPRPGAAYDDVARPRAGARLRGGRPDRRRRRRRRRGEDGDPRAARLRHAGQRSTTSPTRGSPRSSPRTSPTRRSSACR